MDVRRQLWPSSRSGRRGPSCTSSIPISIGGRARCSTSCASARTIRARSPTQRRLRLLRREGAAHISTAGRSGSTSTSSSRTWTGLATRSTWCARSGRSRSSFSDMPAEEGRDCAMMWNEEMAGAQRKYPGRRVGQRRGAAAGHPDRDRGARSRHQQARADGRQYAGQRRQRSRASTPSGSSRSTRASRSSACRCSCIRPTRCSRTCSTAMTARCTSASAG